MAFSVSRHTDVGWWCDKCKKVPTEQRPLVVFIQSSGRGHGREYHEIRLHVDCLEALVKKVNR